MPTRRTPRRPKRQPLRSCLGCGLKRPKKELVRVVRTPSGSVELDPGGRRAGRGAYVCPSGDCLKAAVKARRLEKALETAVPDDVLETLSQAVNAGLTPVPAGKAPGTALEVAKAPPSPDPTRRDPMKG
ncbi:MAG: YlxR family protein [Bacillota bacterium]|nr:MAG: YlxR family protein [Bacillota bacterium]